MLILREKKNTTNVVPDKALLVKSSRKRSEFRKYSHFGLIHSRKPQNRAPLLIKIVWMVIQILFMSLWKKNSCQTSNIVFVS